MILLAAAFLAASCSSEGGEPAVADRVSESGITVRDARMAIPATEDAAIYLTIENNTGADDVLVGSLSEIALMMHFHLSEVEVNGQASMDDDEVPGGITIPAGETVRLDPGGRHIMAMQADPVEVGETFELTLLFRDAGQVVTEVDVVRVVEPT